MEPSNDPNPDLRLKFELSYRRRQVPLLPWLVIGIVLIGVIERLVRMWIET